MLIGSLALVHPREFHELAHGRLPWSSGAPLLRERGRCAGFPGHPEEGPAGLDDLRSEGQCQPLPQERRQPQQPQVHSHARCD
eukprot:4160083-Lingulodinium_polyedra.AAC.1